MDTPSHGPAPGNGTSRTGSRRFIRFFSEIGIADVPLVGGKNASLGEMFRELTPKGIAVPHGFAITAEAYRYTLDQAGAWPELRKSPPTRAQSSMAPACPPICKLRFARRWRN